MSLPRKFRSEQVHHIHVWAVILRSCKCQRDADAEEAVQYNVIL
jgi:hypothetical protein